MTKPIKATAVGLRPHFKVRVVIGSSLLHLASWTEPKVIREDVLGGAITVLGRITHVTADWVDHPDYGDTPGYIDWPEAKAVTWRWSA